MRAIWTLAAALVLGVGAAVSAAPPKTIEAPRVVMAATQPVGDGADLGGRLKRMAEKSPANVAAQLDYQLYRYLSEEPAASDEELGKLSPEEREIVSAIAGGLRKFRAAARMSPSAMLGEKIEPMLEMAESLRERANLTVNNFTLCESVDHFGLYEPLAPGALQAGKNLAAIVYCEVENFRSKQTAGGMWETKLKYELAMYSEVAPGKAVFSKPATPVVDQCRSKRRDFFIADKITLPKKLTAGKYVMKVTLTDELGKRVGEASLGVELK